MKAHRTSFVIVLCALVSTRVVHAERPLALHPDNPHYFLFRSKPTALITSGEHYGAVLNLDFDYVKYLDTLAADGLNLTRTFTGSYVEPVGAFKIERNTLAPAADRFICPWARSDTPGYANGGNKFDLHRWDEAYFKRLKDFVRQAGHRGIIVEVNLFCPFYEDSQWGLSPQNAVNNVNGVGKVARTDVYTIDKHGGLLAIHEAMVHKILSELNEFDNLYYEICNEPYFGGVTLDWQRHIAKTIVEAEKKLPHQHLISQNIANGKAKVDDPFAGVSIFNFHYASPPETVSMNHGLNKVIGDNETGFKGTGDTHYRMEGWEFILAGGGLYNNLDYSFTVGHEDGTFQYPTTQPGGGSAALRRQLRILKDFIQGFEFLSMKPDDSIIRVRDKSSAAHARALVEPGRQYAIYVFGGHEVELAVELAAADYQVEWLNTLTGKIDHSESLKHTGGSALLKSPQFQDDIALRIVRQTSACGASLLPEISPSQIGGQESCATNPLPQTESPYAGWSHGPSKDPTFFPLAVWLQNPNNAAAYKEAGINVFVGLWRGPTAEQLDQLEAAGMKVICAQNSVALERKTDETIIGWMHGDEPDNAQPKSGGYGPPIATETIVERFRKLRDTDPSRPVLLNLGQGVAWDEWYGRGVRSRHPEDYPEYVKGCDIASFDIYPVVHDNAQVAGNLWYVAKGVERLRAWSKGEKVVWNCIEASRVSNPSVKPSAAQVKAEVWMSLIHGSMGIIYFVHQFKPDFVEASLLRDRELLRGVTEINRQVHSLAPVLNSPTVPDGAGVTTSNPDVPVATMVKRHGGSTYLFAVAMRDTPVRASFTIRGGPAQAAAHVLGESRSIPVQNARFEDEFKGYEVHLYRLE